MPPTNQETLEARWDRTIACLLQAPTLAAAAEAVGVAVSTLDRWMHDPAFLARYREARRRVLEAAAGRVADALAEAVGALRRNLECGHAATEVRAALAFFDLAYRDAELASVEDRVEVLEAKLTSAGRWSA